MHPSSVNAAPSRRATSEDCGRCLLLNSLSASGMSRTSIQAICSRMWLNRVQGRQVVFLEGNEATHLYAVRTGRVKLFKSHPDGREHITTILVPGDMFGFEAVFGSSYATGAQALAESQLCLIRGCELRRLMADVPSLGLDVARYLHHTLARLQERQLYAAAPRASAKVAGYLLHGLTTEDVDEGTVGAARSLTLRDIGGILGLSPETVCRVIRTLRTRGIVATDKSGIRVLDVPALQDVAGR